MAVRSIDRDAALLAAATLAIHLAANPHYGFFRDELYFIVCGRHPDWGYVDQPPIVPLLAAGSQLAGRSLFALRAVPALFAAATVYAACRLTRRMGGDRFAVILAALGTALAPVLSAFGSVWGPDSVEMLLWPLAILSVARALDGEERWWLAAGAALGIAAQAKYSAVIFAAALLIGLLATPRRRALLSWWPWAGMLLGAAILLPNLLWQAAEGLPMLELLRNGQHGKNVVLDPASFLVEELKLTNPVLALLWLAGLAWCLIRPAWRWLGIAFCALLAIMILLHGKAYYPTPIYPALFAAGAAAVGGWTPGRPVLRGALLVMAGLFGAVLTPLTMPFLPEPEIVDYLALLRRMGILPSATEHHKSALLGQVYADMHGWQELADQVAALYAELPPDIRTKTQIFTANYGEAAAIDVLAPSSGLPPVLSGHNQYWLWGPGAWDGTALIDIGGDLEADRPLCGSVTLLGTFSAPYVMPYEDGRQIILCRDLKPPVAELWPQLKHYE